jgi:pimeloyl-ACP methyl ester carboxylesterase
MAPHRHLEPRSCWGALLVAVSLVTVAGCSGSSSEPASRASSSTSTAAATTTSTSAPLAPFDGADLYDPPDPLPEGEPGMLLRYAVAPELDLPGRSIYRILYLSESLAGEPIAVSGLASVPSAPAPEGGRPLLTVTHGTTGIADDCAPSRTPLPTEFTLATGILGEELIIAQSDYEGLGTPGRHPYLVGESEGRGALDAIRAATQLPDAEGGDSFAVAGYSQGGHAAAWTAEIAAEWAPELELVGAMVGAPVSELDRVLEEWPHQANAFGLAYLAVAGMEAAHPDAPADGFLTELGAELLPIVDERCTPAVAEAFAPHPVEDLIRAEPASDRWAELARESSPGHAKTHDAPTLLVHSREDTLIPLSYSEAYHGRLCSLGQVSELRVLPTGEHYEAGIAALQLAAPWIEERFDGSTEPVDTCEP